MEQRHHNCPVRWILLPASEEPGPERWSMLPGSHSNKAGIPTLVCQFPGPVYFYLLLHCLLILSPVFWKWTMIWRIHKCAYTHTYTYTHMCHFPSYLSPRISCPPFLPGLRKSWRNTGLLFLLPLLQFTLQLSDKEGRGICLDLNTHSLLISY